MKNRDPKPGAIEERILILAPTPRDTQLCTQMLSSKGFTCAPCADMSQLCACLEEGAGAALLTEEAFATEESAKLLRWLRNQPSWSDFPLLFLAHGGADSPEARRAMDLLGNVILLERPIRIATLISAARVALRARERQYTTRGHLKALDRDRKTAENANRAKSQFLANMSHEIRTPMTVIMGAMEFLHQSALAEQQRYVDMAQHSAERLLRLIDDILDFSRIEARRLEIHLEPFSLSECIEKITTPFYRETVEKGLRLEVRIDPQAPQIVYGDPMRLEQVLINLISNAVKFTERGKIGISVETIKGDFLRIRVSDTGIGIPADRLDRLFRSFSQVDSSRTRRYGGTGLGLAISKGLTELMGGTIEAQSREGEGSEFTVRLPLLRPKPDDSAKEEPVSKEWEVHAGRGRRILVAEDDDMVRELLKTMLARQGWQVATAVSGREALSAWRKEEYDLILMDVQMPEIDGLTATRAIRQQEPAGRRIPIIALTAHARKEDQEECLAAGMDDFISKPIRMDDFLQRIERNLT
jgi:signal transduction histidine kinase/CheY-like chemotaxis protein